MATGWYLEKRTGSSDKFYAAVVGDGFTAARWGRRGTAGQSAVWHDERGRAKVRAKVRDGYRQVVDDRHDLHTPDPSAAVDVWLSAIADTARADVAAQGLAPGKLWVAPGFTDCAERNPAGAVVAAGLSDAGRVVACVNDHGADVALVSLTDAGRLRRSWPVPLQPVGPVVVGDDDTVLATALAVVGDVLADAAAWELALQAARAL